MKRVKKLFFVIVVIFTLLTVMQTSCVWADNLVTNIKDKYGNEYTVTPQDVLDALRQIWVTDPGNYDSLTDDQLIILSAYVPQSINNKFVYDNNFKSEVQSIVAIDSATTGEPRILGIINQTGVLEEMAKTAASQYEIRKGLEQSKEDPENEGLTEEEIIQKETEEFNKEKEELERIYSEDTTFESKTEEEIADFIDRTIAYLNEYKIRNNGAEDGYLKIALQDAQERMVELGGDAKFEESFSGPSSIEEMETIEIPEYTVSGIVVRPGESGVEGEDLTNPADNPDAYKPGEMGNNDTLIRLGGIIVGALKIIGIITGVVTLVILGIKYIAGSSEEKAEYKKTMIPYVIGAMFLGVGGVLIELIFNLIAGIQF